MAAEFLHQLRPKQIRFIETRHIESIDLIGLSRVKNAIVMIKLVSVNGMPDLINQANDACQPLLVQQITPLEMRKIEVGECKNDHR